MFSAAGTVFFAHVRFWRCHGTPRPSHRLGYRFRKVGVLLSVLRQASEVQSGFYGPSQETIARRQKLMATLDQVNRSCGRGTVRLGSAGVGEPKWGMRQDHLSRCYTTRWAELLAARA